MTRLHFTSTLLLAIAAVLGARTEAAAQPGKGPGGIQFKQFGTTPEQFYQSSVTRWTGQLVLDLEHVKAEAAKAGLAPVARTAINTQIDRAILQTTDLDQQVRRGAQKDKLFTEFAEVEKSLNVLVATINQHPAARQATTTTLARVELSYTQLGAALGTGDTDPDRAKRRLIRLSESIDDNAEDLRNLVGELIGGNDRGLERLLGQYAREARLLARRARSDTDPETLKRVFTAMADRWADAAAVLARVRGLPAAVESQWLRVDALHRRLGTALGVAPGNGGPNPGPIPLPPNQKRIAFAVGAEAGAQPRVTVFADEKGTVAYNFFAYDVRFDGGVRVDMADLNGDGVPDLIVAPGPSKLVQPARPVRVYDGRDLNLLVEFVPFADWKGGLYASGADLSRDGKALIAVTAEGTQHVKVFDLAQGKEIDSFFIHDQKVTGGVRLAWGDINGDGTPDLLTVNGAGNAPTQVKIFNGENGDVLAEFPVLDAKYRGGAFITAADLDNNGRANPVIGLDAGNVPLVRVYDAKGKPVSEWLAYDERFRGGVRVAVSARSNVVVGPGFGLKNSPVRIFDAARPKVPLAEIVPFAGFDGGINVGGR